MKKLNKKGFTIVELVIVIAVIAILAAVMIPTFSGVIQSANESKALQKAKISYTEYLIAHPEAEIDYVKNSEGTIFDVNDEYKVVSEAATGSVVLEIGTCLDEKGEDADGKCDECGWTLTVVEEESVGA